MLRSVANRVVCLGFALWCPWPAPAASTAAIEACATIAEDAARLACFDREVGALHAHAKAAAPPAVAAAPAATQLTEEQKMGLTPGRIQKLERPASTPPAPASLEFVMQSVALDANGHQVFTLQNGQVWRQVETDSRFAVSAGETVLISHGIAGSYFMSYGKHRNTRVTRVR